MRFYIVTVCLAAFLVYVVSEQCHKDDDLSRVCTLTACTGNNTIMICEHDECTCAIDPNVPCSMKSDCEDLPEACGHHGHHKRAPGHGDKAWHCLDNLCKCF